ncbi:MAG: zinc ABC transporter substrate-binding protein [Treponema sp.]|jgi:zinc transport system substrate-binding protein|nr:zinc ABC transporter substrate-binding protein [Treponema sp.]
MKAARVSTLLCIFFVLSCPKPDSSSTKPVIAVSVLPQAWFVEQIARESGFAFDILTLAGPGQNPHTFEPSPKQLESLARAKVWMLSGSEFEISLRPKVEKLFKNLVIVDGTQGVRFRTLEPGVVGEDDGIDRHSWLGREPAKILAAHIRDQLSTLDKDNAGLYERNCQELAARIDAEFESLRQELAPLSGKPVFVYHPAFGYFLDEFNIRQEAVETGGKEPGPQALNTLVEKAGREKPAAIFVQTQFPAATAKTVADATGAAVVALDPLSRDWLENIRAMGEALKRSARAYDTPLN